MAWAPIAEVDLDERLGMVKTICLEVKRMLSSIRKTRPDELKTNRLSCAPGRLYDEPPGSPADRPPCVGYGENFAHRGGGRSSSFLGDRAMTGRMLLMAVLPVGVLSTAVVGQAQKPAEPATPEAIETAFRVSLAAAAEYVFRVGDDERPLELVPESRLKWSNPSASDIQGNVFVWTRDGRPLVVGCFMKWFQSRTAIQHEFHSLAEGPLKGSFHGAPVWATEEAGVKFADVPGAPIPAAGDAQRLLQLRKLGKEFSAIAHYRNTPDDAELRLLPQPIHSYVAPKQGVLTGGLFAFVRGTDPELWLLVEARGKDAGTARWQFAAARMTNMAELRLRHRDKQVWEVGLLPYPVVSGSHRLPYTAYEFRQVPDFLRRALDKPKP
jgi:hypothetical protein